MADRFWVGGSGNWSDATNHWATTTGGAPGAGNLPTTSDNAIFDTASHTVGYTVTINALAECSNLTFGAPLTGTITWAGSSALYFSGNLTLLSGMTRTFTGLLTSNIPSGTATITSNGISVDRLVMEGAGTLQLTDTLLVRHLQLSAGVFSANTKLVQLTAASGAVITQGSFTGASSFYDLTIASNTITATITNNNITITGTLTASGSSASSRCLILSNTVGTPRTITAAAVSLTDVDFTDITGAGAAAPFTGTRIGDAKGNSGITFTAAANKYYVGNTANWNSANVWALTSGGAGATNNFPLAQDTAVLDAGSFSANGQTLTINAAFRIGSLLCSGTDQTYTLTSGAYSPIFYGDVTLDSNTTTGGSATWIFSGRNTQSLTSAGIGWIPRLKINSLGGTVKLVDNYTYINTSSIGFTLTSGTLDLNGKTFSTWVGVLTGSTARTLKDSSAGGGKFITLSTTAETVLSSATTTNLTIDRTNPWTIEIGGNTANIRTMNLGAGKTWPAISFTNTTAGGELDIVSSGAATVIKSLSVTNPAQTIKRTAGTTITIEDNNGFPSGTVGNLVTIGSLTAASHTWAKSGGGRIESDYLSISRSTATPATTWYAGANSTDGGNNSGWTFAPYTPSTYVNGFMAWF